MENKLSPPSADPGALAPKPTLASLSAALREVLANPNPDQDTFARQADLLDCLLYTVMRQSLESATQRGHFHDSEIALALRIQKQCAETLKAAISADYMQSIVSLSTGIYPPRVLAHHPSPEKMKNKLMDDRK